MQGGLIDDRAREGGRSIALTGESEAPEPVAPTGIELPMEANLIPARFVAVTWRVTVIHHVLPVSSPGDRRRGSGCRYAVEVRAVTRGSRLWCVPALVRPQGEPEPDQGQTHRDGGHSLERVREERTGDGRQRGGGDQQDAGSARQHTGPDDRDAKQDGADDVECGSDRGERGERAEVGDGRLPAARSSAAMGSLPSAKSRM